MGILRKPKILLNQKLDELLEEDYKQSVNGSSYIPTRTASEVPEEVILAIEKEQSSVKKQGFFSRLFKRKEED